jgi:hypothetical protein
MGQELRTARGLRAAAVRRPDKGSTGDERDLRCYRYLFEAEESNPECGKHHPSMLFVRADAVTGVSAATAMEATNAPKYSTSILPWCHGALLY